MLHVEGRQQCNGDGSTQLLRATGEAMNFQGNTIDLDNVSNTEELGLILLLVLMTVKPNGMNLNGLSSTHILWEISAVK